MKDRTVIIYCLACPLSGEIRYVGKTAMGLMKRYSQHMRLYRTDHKNSWLKSLKSQGLKPVISELERFENSDDTDWQEAERFWICYLRFLGCRLTNMEEGGRGGMSHPLEVKLKISLGNKGKNLGKKMPPKSAEYRAAVSARFKGRKLTEAQKEKLRGPKKLSPETREKMRLARLGKSPSLETRQKMSASRKGKPGRPMTPEHKAKLIASHVGKPWSEASREKLRATMKATGAVQRLLKAPRPEKAWNRGIAHSEETKAKMSAAHKALGTGKSPKSQEHRDKIAAALRGRTLSEEGRAKLRGPRGPNIRTLRKLAQLPESTLSMPDMSPPMGLRGS